MGNKYKINKDGRVVALRDFGNVSKGDIGGIVGSEKNLSQHGDAWVSGNAEVHGNAEVSGNAWVIGILNIGFCPTFIGSKHYVSYSGVKDNKHYISIGCEVHTLETWFLKYREIGKSNGYSDGQIDEYGYYISIINEILKREGLK